MEGLEGQGRPSGTGVQSPGTDLESPGRSGIWDHGLRVGFEDKIAWNAVFGRLGAPSADPVASSEDEDEAWEGVDIGRAAEVERKKRILK